MLYKPEKKWGQNFLMDFGIASQMVKALDLASNDVIVEIGPGLGALTKILVDRLIDPSAQIIAIEIDKRFVMKLDQMFLTYPNFKVVEADILDWLPGFESERDFKILGSLPFYITSPILHNIIKRERRPTVCVLLIQKEVAQKVCANVPDASYLSTFVQTFFEVQHLFDVSKDKFKPSPKVDGAVVKFTRRESLIPFDCIKAYEGFLHKGFSSPRKMLNKVFSKKELVRVGVDSSLRPQNLDVEKWVEMFRAFVPR